MEATYVLLALLFLAAPAFTQSSTAFVQRICEQCDSSWCPENALRLKGPDGAMGEKGRKGQVGQRGTRGDKGDAGSSGAPNASTVEQLFERKIREAIYGLPSSEQSPYQSCSDVRKQWANGESVLSGLVDLALPGIGVTEAYCDFTTDGGDWIIFQRRIDGSQSFYQEWDEYVNGFGDREHEYWLGLEALHHLTSRGKWEMRIDMISVNDMSYYVKYRQFYVGPRSDNYRLHIGRFSGRISDAMESQHGNQQFSTRGADNDNNPERNCASKWSAGWWYNDCIGITSNLNGQYGVKIYGYAYGVSWYVAGRGWMYMKRTEMKIRERK